MNAPVNPHCEKRWPFNAAEPFCLLGDGIARAIEATYGASIIAQLLHADSEIRVGIECGDNPSEAPPRFSNNVTAGLFAALHTCLDTVNLELERMPGRVEQRDTFRAAAAGKAAQPAKAARVKP